MFWSVSNAIKSILVKLSHYLCSKMWLDIIWSILYLLYVLVDLPVMVEILQRLDMHPTEVTGTLTVSINYIIGHSVLRACRRRKWKLLLAMVARMKNILTLKPGRKNITSTEKQVAYFVKKTWYCSPGDNRFSKTSRYGSDTCCSEERFGQT